MKVCSKCVKTRLRRGETYQLVDTKECVFCNGGVYFSDYLNKVVKITKEG